MNITEVLGVPVADSTSPDDLSTPKCSIPGAVEPLPEPAPLRRGWAWMAFASVAALVVGFGAGKFAAALDTGLPSPTPGTATEAPPANLGDFAEFFASLHLTGLTSAADMSPLYVGEPPQAATGMWVNRSAAIAVEPLGDGLWIVTVAVDAFEIVDGAYEAAGIQYFDITVDNSGDHPIAVTAPARVPEPGVARTPPSIPTFAGTVPPDQLTAVTAFFEAYLAAHGELARYVSTTARIPAFRTPPYESISIVEADSDSPERVRIELEATTPHGGRHRLEYVTEMTFERGVWEISSLVPLVVEI